MKLGNADLIRLLPAWMKDDAFDAGISPPVSEALNDTYDTSRLLSIWDAIDRLPESMLDELAWALHVEWYETGAAIETKRALIKSSDLVHARKGTVSAVEEVIRSYFGDGYLVEWPDYGGEPHHFKAYTTNPTLVGENLDRFLALLDKVKRKSSKLDGVQIGLTGQQTVYVGEAKRDCSIVHVQMGNPEAKTYAGFGCSLRDHVRVRMGATWLDS